MTERPGEPDPTRVFRAEDAEPSAGPGEELVGTVFAGRYRILRCLGKGAMGAVYEAEHVKIGRRDAIKVLQASIARDPEATQRFLRGARNASRIRHPNVGAIYDFGETPDGLQYLAMEFVEGQTLTGLIRSEGPLDLERSLHIVRQIAAGLQAAHDQGIVHRDLKPDNVMVGRTRTGADFVKVVDFDIARGSAEGEGMDVTRAGFVVGTPEYMSPEQLTGDALDGRSDLYSLGLVLFRMVTGTLPFKGSTAQELMVQRLTRDPLSLAETAPGRDFPPALQPFFDRALSRAADRRFPDAAAFADALAELVGTAPAPLPGTVPVGPPTGRTDGGGSEELPGTRVRPSPAATGDQGAAGERPARAPLVWAAVAVLAVVGVGAGGIVYLAGDRESATALAPDDVTSTPAVDGEDDEGAESDPAGGAGTTEEPGPRIPPADRPSATPEGRIQPGDPERDPAEPTPAAPALSAAEARALLDRQLAGYPIEPTPAALRAIRDSVQFVWDRAEMSRADSARAAYLMGIAILDSGAAGADRAQAGSWLETAVRLDPGNEGYRTILNHYREGG